MASLSFKLNAFDYLNDPKLKAFLEYAKKAKDNENGVLDISYKLFREEEISRDNKCRHCPKYLLLTEQINKVIDNIAKDPKTNISEELPIKINRLKFLYYTQALREKNGEIKCQRFMDLTPDLKPTKFDGQFKLIAEDALKFNSVTDIQYINPNLKEVVYYYRGEGAEKNIVVQAILTPGGGKFRYYRYTPTALESNPYNLPDMNKIYPEPERTPTLADKIQYHDVDPHATPVLGLAATPDNYKLNFKAELEKRNKYIPNNIHFVDASMNTEIGGGISVKGSSDTSIKGNVANLAIKNGNSDLVLIDVDTKLNGRTDHRITIPYSIHILDSAPDFALKGKLQQENNAKVITMSLTDKAYEYVRSEYRKNTSTNKDSYVIARDIHIEKDEVLSMQFGKSEEDKKFASLRHAKSLKNNITLVLDVRVDQDKKITLLYQVSAKF